MYKNQRIITRIMVHTNSTAILKKQKTNVQAYINITLISTKLYRTTLQSVTKTRIIYESTNIHP